MCNTVTVFRNLPVTCTGFRNLAKNFLSDAPLQVFYMNKGRITSNTKTYKIL